MGLLMDIHNNLHLWGRLNAQRVSVFNVGLEGAHKISFYYHLPQMLQRLFRIHNLRICIRMARKAATKGKTSGMVAPTVIDAEVILFNENVR